MPSDSVDLEQLKQLFHAARAVTTDKRQAFLDQNCHDDPELRRQIEALLKSSDETNGFITGSPVQLAADAFAAREVPSERGLLIGQYRVLERIGSGGMGDVYLAERADHRFEMRVAIKLIKRGMDTESVLRRFHNERQILASLEHPNIARLLDGGETNDGLPYFVMEYIQGKRVDHFAEDRGLTIEQRLELFRQVCGAVSYAHQRLVVHRDLKPSNILVTADGVPKLLDFGIAKLVQTGAGEHEAVATITAAPIMTPEYASPEQIQGIPATTLSDVYSLGAILYELLSGRPPHRFKTRSSQEIAEVITRSELARPSTVAARAEDARQLRGDLDNIVLMAMRKETARRYHSVEQFSEDIRRHLVGRPVIAQPDVFSYRARKFLQRNKVSVAAGALIFVSLVGGIIATTWEAHRATLQEQNARAQQARAERRFNDVRKLANSVLFDYHDAIKNLPGATKVRERLVKDALTYLDSLASEAQGDPALQRELATAYERVGDVRGGVGTSLGDTAGALESYRKALKMRETIVAANPVNPKARHELAISYQKVGEYLRGPAQSSERLEYLRKAVAIYLDLIKQQPGDDDLQLDLAVAYDRLGIALNDRRDFPAALQQYDSALAICEKPATDRRDQRFRRALWNTYRGIANVLFQQGDVARAIATNGKSIELGEALVADDPLNTEHRRALVMAYQNGADYCRRTDKTRALDYFRRALTVQQELVSADPASASNRRTLAYGHKRIADFLANLHDDSEALAHFIQATEIYEKVAADVPTDSTSRLNAALSRTGVAGMQARLGQLDSALQECRNAISLLQNIPEDQATGDDQYGVRAEVYEYAGYAYQAISDSPKLGGQSKQYTSAARDMFRRSLDILENLRSQGKLSANNQVWAKEIAAEVAKCDTALAKDH